MRPATSTRQNLQYILCDQRQAHDKTYNMTCATSDQRTTKPTIYLVQPATSTRQNLQYILCDQRQAHDKTYNMTCATSDQRTTKPTISCVTSDLRTTKPTIWLMQPARTPLSLRIRAVWSESSLIACAPYSLQAIQRGINENPCQSWWMHRLICLCWSYRCYCRF